MWGKPLNGTARELLRETDDEQDADGDSASDVEAFVRRCLVDGPVSSRTMQADTNGAGYSWDRVKRAATRIGVEKHKTGMQGGWEWSLPSATRREECNEGSEESTQQRLHSSYSSVLPSDDAEVF